MQERKFTTLYMPPWSVDELQAVYFSDPENEGEYMEFWAKYYVAGPIIRHYVTPLIKVFSEKLTAVEKVVDGGVLNATLLKAHEIFVSWPTLDFTRVDHFSFASEWAADCFAIACFNGQIKNWIASTLFLAANRSLRSAAGVLFERVAHYRLSMGGDFCSIDDLTRKLHLEKREVKYFSGNSLDLQIPGLYYLQPSSTSFPVIDSVYPPLVLFQISIATKQRPMKKCDYDALCSSLMAFRNEHPDIPSGLEGVPEPNRVHAILVKMEGDNAKHSQRLCMVEDAPEDAPANETAPRRSARKRARTQRSISKVKQGETAGVMKKRTFLPFQMTIALKMDHTVPDTLDYPSLQQIHDIVCARMDGAVDTGARKFGDIKREEADFARVLMRQGKGSIQYEEEMDGVPVFGAWIEAVRTKEGSDSVEKTVLTIQCTAGKLAGRELTLFVNERLLPDKEFSNPLVLNMLRLEAVSGADDAAYQVCWSGATASVVIRSNRRASRKLMLVFPTEQTEEEEDDYKEEDYMEI
ncbi:uncharacterized protein LOC112349439 [Selaginella moellendorffii]|uniref:uncharacterized protein LOC112349439 n=1 Tax=Selaginella moellendorffii TaxID=88036 RepID=UPI000D1CEE90|nr:uncharacterized protein LOC112349439 [Selaginella moellendorffii]|eukprot:XP_024539633.1 uncharacterized protein LOC112349439 [Selaginella moellendorffii]